MQKSEVAEGLIRYIFDPLPGKYFGNNIFSVIDDGKVLLIDTAYEFQAIQALEDINSNGLKIAGIIISHFHDDHMQGLKALPRVTTYGSEHYAVTLEMWTERDEHKFFTPTVTVKDDYAISFGKHEIVLIPFPGHSLCTVMTKIDDKFLHIADELMFSNDGKSILPSADPHCMDRHVASLSRLRAYASHVFVPGHGPELSGKEKINREIDNRIAYFDTILKSNNRITYEEAIRNCDCDFLHSEWHEYVYE